MLILLSKSNEKRETLSINVLSIETTRVFGGTFDMAIFHPLGEQPVKLDPMVSMLCFYF